MQGMILLAHGARHPSWADPFRRVQQKLLAKRPGLLVELAFLEFMPPNLSSAIEQMVERGAEDITVVPIFMGQSGHVLREVPPMIERARQAHPQLSLQLAMAAGEDEGVIEALATYCLHAVLGNEPPVS